MQKKMVILFISILCCFMLNAQDYTFQKINKQFQVVAHIVLDSSGASNVDSLQIVGVFNHPKGVNWMFSPLGFSFKVCEVRIIPNFQYHDTLRALKMTDEVRRQYFAKNRINIFYIGSHSMPTAAGVCYSNVGEGQGTITISQNRIKTVAHELGHHFGLVHTFGAVQNEPSTELVDSSNCSTSGDFVCDTPADPFEEDLGSGAFANGCRFTNDGVTDSNNKYYDPDMYNIMNYYDCDDYASCADPCGFTRGQFIRMKNEYLKSLNSRKSW